jgi:Ca-activated chloride channel homolog
VDLVTLHVSVRDAHDKFLTDLKAAEFRVLEAGKSQHLAFFRPTGLPLTLTLLFDTSGSVRWALPAVKSAAIDFVKDLHADDLASVIAFDSQVAVLQNFTNDRVALADAVRRVGAGGMTSVYTAVYVALKELARPSRERSNESPRRRVIVLLSDGDDNASLINFDDLLQTAMESDVAIYAIRLGPAPLRLHGPEISDFVLRRLSEQTGGRAFFTPTERDLPRIYEQIHSELVSQYALAYVSNDRDHGGGFRPLAVLVTRPGAVARTKRGYIAVGR